MAAIEAGMRSYVADLEALIRRQPSQWYCFYPFWDDPARGPASRSQEKTTSAAPLSTVIGV
jgi:predicted LPLAT superfamily acyltransferase